MLIAPARSISYPSGLRPRFDSSHPLNAWVGSTRGISAVCVGINMIDLRSSKRGNVLQGTRTTKLSGHTGLGVTFGGTNPLIGFTGRSAAIDTQFTYAAIFTMPAANAATMNIMFQDDSGAGGTQFTVDSSNKLNIGAGSLAVFNPALVLGAPYFVIASLIGNGTTVNFAATRLDTGRIDVQTGSITPSGSGAPAGTYAIGNLTAGNAFSAGPFGGFLHSVYNSPRYTSAAECFKFASDPWSLWYPSQIEKLIFGVASPPPAGYTPFNPWPQSAPILAM